ncbi:MAG: class I SAM-dependent methyltransferase [Candidatus Heimdallarchaeota archaeon]|nr:class I SAM-dependent methyltransferase [Candidatus Heimdallarchaeota archaeon]
MNIFSKVAKKYDNFVGKFNLDEIIDYLPLDTANLLLDLGGGTGRVAEQLQDIVNECIVFDYSYEMLLQAKSKTDRFLLIQGSGENLPFREKSLQQIFLNDSFHHIKEQKETLEESYRVLKPGGKLIIREFDKSYFWNFILRFLEFIVGFGSTFYSPKKLGAICEEIGFKVSWEKPNKSTYILIAEK